MSDAFTPSSPSTWTASLLLCVLSYSMIVVAVVTFYTTMLIKAPYGRYSTSKGWGPLLPARFAWFVMESPNLIAVLVVQIHYASKECRTLCNNVLLGMFSLHYLNRAVLYPLRMNRNANPMPASVTLLAFLYCSWNGLTQSLSLGVVNALPASHASSPQFLLGVAVFFTGMFINVHSDALLQALRHQPPGSSNKVGVSLPGSVRAAYKIPRGGFFDLLNVSCANYTGEIVEWAGFALACWSVPALAFAIFTFCNIGTRARHHHQNYLEKFKEDYPSSRTAVVPFLW